jgi:hypothetical protein
MTTSTIERPTWSQAYRLGVQINKEMDHYMTLEQVARELGITKQNAYTETVLAIGTLAWMVRKRLGIPTCI